MRALLRSRQFMYCSRYTDVSELLTGALTCRCVARVRTTATDSFDTVYGHTRVARVMPAMLDGQLLCPLRELGEAGAVSMYRITCLSTTYRAGAHRDRSSAELCSTPSAIACDGRFHERWHETNDVCNKTQYERCARCLKRSAPAGSAALLQYGTVIFSILALCHRTALASHSAGRWRH